MTQDTNAVVGEETLNTADVQVKEIPLVTPGKYTAKLKGVSVQCGKEWNSVPSVSIQNKLENNRIIFGSLNLGLAPDKNGQLSIERKNGAKAVLKLFDTNIEGWKIHKEERTNPSGEKVTIKFLDAKQLVDVLEQYKDSSYQIRVNISKGTGGYSDKNDIFEYFPAE